MSLKLRDEATLEQAEAERDVDAAEALRVANAILVFRCSFLGSEKP